MSGSPVTNVRATLGALFIGIIIYTMLFGLIIGQTWIYVWHYWTKDSNGLKLFIAFITFLDLVSTIITVYAVYYFLILNFGDINVSNKWILGVQANISSISCTAVQFYYARRIYVVSQNIFFPLVIVVVCTIGTAIGYYITAKQLTTQVNSRFSDLSVFGYLGMGSSVLVDIFISSVMCWALYRKKTGIARTDSIIITLMVYTINTGVVTLV